MRSPIVVIAAGLLGSCSSGLVCGEGTVERGGRCVVASVDASTELDAGREDAGVLVDASVLADAGSPSDAEAPGGACDPNFFVPRCDGAARVVCERGTVEAQPCATGETCAGGLAGIACVPADAERCSEPFAPRCDGDAAVYCDAGLGVVYRVECGDLACTPYGDSVQCLGEDAAPCDPSSDPGAACVDADHIRRCIPGDGGEYVRQTIECPSGWDCVPPHGTVGATCVPEGRPLCDPASYVPTCEGRYFTMCFAEGYLGGPPGCRGDECVNECPASDECFVVTWHGLMIPGCRQPGAAPCDSTYEPWCEGNTRVFCRSLHVRREPCDTGLLCELDDESPDGIECVPEPPVSP